MNAYERILQNLENRPYFVSLPFALHGTEFHEGNIALKKLVQDGRVTEKREHITASSGTYLVYRLQPLPPPRMNISLVVNNDKD